MARRKVLLFGRLIMVCIGLSGSLVVVTTRLWLHKNLDSPAPSATTTTSVNVKQDEKTTKKINAKADRFAPLDSELMTGFVHISKCAGVSWIQELQQWLTPEHVFPKKQTGDEYSVFFHRTKQPTDHLLTSLKSPRHHVWSMYTECRYDGWGQKVTRDTKFPRRGETALADLADFEEWLMHFLTPNLSYNASDPNNKYYYQIDENVTERHNCYHPANYMTRHFVSKFRYVHGVDTERRVAEKQVANHLPFGRYQNRGSTISHQFPHRTRNFPQNVPSVPAPPTKEEIHEHYEPPMTPAMKTYWSLDWVSVTELFVESKCLLYYRYLVGKVMKADDNDSNSNATTSPFVTETDRFLENNCKCPAPATLDAIHHSHHAQGQRASMRDNMTEPILHKIDALTRSDVKLYKSALVQLIKELIWLEDQLGRRVLCDTKLKWMTYELEYLGKGNFKKLYKKLKKEFKAQKKNNSNATKHDNKNILGYD